MTAHSDCTHPSTKAARAACRANRPATAEPRMVRDTEGRHAPRMTPKRRARAEARAEAIVDETITTKRDELNARRLRATQAKAASQAGARGECFVCGLPAGWTDRDNDQPVCIKHVDYDNCRIISL